MIMSNLISITNLKCLFSLREEWRRVKKYFKRPKWYFNRYVDTYDKPVIFNLYVSPLMWKPKWDYYSVERCPGIHIKIYNTHFNFNLGAPDTNERCDDYMYFECMLEYYFTKNIKSTYENNIWTRHTTEKSEKITIKPYLTEHALKEIEF